MNLSENLKKIRKDHNLSQEQLAEKLNVSRQSVSKWESGSAYPEMDKMIQLCKMFDLNIDELLNKDIKEVKESKQSKSNINKYIDDFLTFMSKTVNMFSSLKFGDKIKCLFEQFIIVLALYIASAIVGSILSSVASSIFSFLPSEAYNILFSLLRGIYVLAFLVLGVVVLLHIFKVRYLDYYIVVDKEEENNEEDKHDGEETKETKKLERKEDKVIIRDPKDSRYGFISGLVKVVLFFVKLFVINIGLMGCFSLITFSMLLAMSFMIVKSGVLFLGVFISLLACIVMNVDVLLFMYYFIINKRPKFLLMGLVFFASLVVLGLGIGLSTMWIKNVTYINEYDGKYILRGEKEIDMNSELSISKSYPIEFIESDNNNIKIVYDYSSMCNVDIKNDGGELYFSNNCFTEEDNFVKSFISVLNDKVIYDPDYLSIKVYTNKDNIDRLETNHSNKIKNDYQNRINELNEKVNELNRTIEEKDNEINGLKEMFDVGEE